MRSDMFPYPATPVNVPASVTDTSPSFKKEVSGVLGSILFFFIIYLLLFILAVGLALACVTGGIFIITGLKGLWGILLGVGLIGVGIMVLLFLIKFLFAVSKFDRSGSIEITEQEQPKLFAFIRQLTKDTQTTFPKKIYLSPEVNACVFYDSSFWSMFFPVKKNLQIGLGLVNALNLSEFKAVMAHEFGHFSQRSMKLGSFVYQVNRVIYNMLYENNSYGNFLVSAARVSDVFAIFVSITIKIIQGIQWILQKMYAVINKSYMRLSREMEFHADAVAASVSGGNNCITALQRIELAASGYNLVIDKYDELFKEKMIGKNAYQNHRVVLKQLADQFNLPLQNELPVVNRSFLDSNNFNRINFKDQWASHPTTEERETALNQLGVNTDTDHDSAWVLFSGKEQLQEELTRLIYRHVTVEGEPITVDNSQFSLRYLQDEERFSLPKVYKGFYDARNNSIFNVDEESGSSEESLTSDLIFNAENAAIPKRIRAMESDIELLHSISIRQADAKSFDFDGEKYKRDQAHEVKLKIEEELHSQRKLLEELDKKAFRFFYQRALKVSTEEALTLKNHYSSYFRLRTSANEFLAQVNKMLEALQPIFRGETQSLEIIETQISTLKKKEEKEFKQNLGEWILNGAMDQQPILKEKINKFIASNYAYFSGTDFFENELAELNQLAVESWQEIHGFLFGRFKLILELQLKNIG